MPETTSAFAAAVVVTGAASGIGAAVVERLIEGDVPVIAADLAWPADAAQPSGVQRVVLDVRDPEGWASLAELAATTGALPPGPLPVRAASTCAVVAAAPGYPGSPRLGDLVTLPLELHDAVMEGAVERVRPKTMTVASTMLGLLPILWSTGTGASVMKRIAAPMVGGMVSSTVLTLLVIPAIWSLWRERQLRMEQRELAAARAGAREIVEQPGGRVALS